MWAPKQLDEMRQQLNARLADDPHAPPTVLDLAAARDAAMQLLALPGTPANPEDV